MKILIVATGAREHAIAAALAKSTRANVELYNIGSTRNPGIAALCVATEIAEVTDVAAIAQFAQEQAIDIAWIGPEAPLSVGIVDALEGLGISCIGPTQELAQLESSKAFTRDLMERHRIPGLPKFRTFFNHLGVAEYMQSLDGNVVVKPDGLTGGKGVKVMGDHFTTTEEAEAYVNELFAAGDDRVVIEEKLVGQEFSLLSFTDGQHVVHMPVVQDHKRVGEGDTGANTGGMGTYTMADHSLPFISEHDVEQAKAINEATLRALKTQTAQEYRGIIYGGYMAVHEGVRVIEFNARFGDPEVMNLLELLETDLVDITEAIANRTLDRLHVEFSHQASVCKYVVPTGYPDSPVKGEGIDVSAVDTNTVSMYYGAVDAVDGQLIETGSRTVAIVAKADTLAEAEQRVETEINKITGPVFHRKDIGTEPLIQARIEMMQKVRP